MFYSIESDVPRETETYGSGIEQPALALSYLPVILAVMVAALILIIILPSSVLLGMLVQGEIAAGKLTFSMGIFFTQFYHEDFNSSIMQL